MVPITKQQGTPYESLEIADEKGWLLVGDVLFISGPFLLKTWPSSCEDSLRD